MDLELGVLTVRSGKRSHGRSTRLLVWLEARRVEVLGEVARIGERDTGDWRETGVDAGFSQPSCTVTLELHGPLNVEGPREERGRVEGRRG